MECAPSILHMWDETVNKIILNTKPIVWFFGLKVTYLTLSQTHKELYYLEGHLSRQGYGYSVTIYGYSVTIYGLKEDDI